MWMHLKSTVVGRGKTGAATIFRAGCGHVPHSRLQAGIQEQEKETAMEKSSQPESWSLDCPFREVASGGGFGFC